MLLMLSILLIIISLVCGTRSKKIHLLMSVCTFIGIVGMIIFCISSLKIYGSTDVSSLSMRCSKLISTQKIYSVKAIGDKYACVQEIGRGHIIVQSYAGSDVLLITTTTGDTKIKIIRYSGFVENWATYPFMFRKQITKCCIYIPQTKEWMDELID